MTEKNLQLAGLISQGGRSNSAYYQMWFTEHHPDMCSIGPTERWLEHAAWRISHDLANDAELYTGISGSFLREYAAHAVRDYIVDQMNKTLGWDSPLRIYPTLDAVLEISRAREEGAWPRGKLLFAEQRSLGSLSYVTRFPGKETPLLENTKHVRKMLTTVENSNRFMVSDGKCIVGIADEGMPDFCVVADFCGQYGYMRIKDELVCSFSGGSFLSTTHRAKLVQVEEALLESNLDSDSSNQLFQVIAHLVHYAEERRIGCTLVVDLNWEPVHISGQKLDQALDLKEYRYLDLARGLLKVDGALHIGRDLHLFGFACLLDGHAIAGEDRARGARFNSALRFTALHTNLFVIVVSADRPVSIIQEGVEVSAQCPYQPVSTCIYEHPPLHEWIADADG
ncbi:MAG: DNA integrity scanning protein DisA nucleotide-binding domain protein [Desulfosarcinaceae bacterium]